MLTLGSVAIDQINQRLASATRLSRQGGKSRGVRAYGSLRVGRQVVLSEGFRAFLCVLTRGSGDADGGSGRGARRRRRTRCRSTRRRAARRARGGGASSRAGTVTAARKGKRRGNASTEDCGSRVSGQNSPHLDPRGTALHSTVEPSLRICRIWTIWSSTAVSSPPRSTWANERGRLRVTSEPTSQAEGAGPLVRPAPSASPVRSPHEESARLEALAPPVSAVRHERRGCMASDGYAYHHGRS
jgi:hypothetical protein